MAGEEDPFGEYLSQDAGQGDAVANAAASGNPEDQLRLLVESSLRQEQLMGKVCSILVGLDEKIGRLAEAQEKLEGRLEDIAANQASMGPSASGGGGGGGGKIRGGLVLPPGAEGLPAPRPQALDAERVRQERARIEEDGKRRAEDIARKRDEDERRKREAAERARMDEDRRREEEKQRKEALEKKTTGLMSGLLTGATESSGLFDAEPKRKNKGGLFDD